MTDVLRNVALPLLDIPTEQKLEPRSVSTHAPRILLLYGSLRPNSYSRLLTLEAERILRHLGAQTKVFDPHGLPVTDSVPADHPKVAELRALSAWSEGQVWRVSAQPISALCALADGGLAVALGGREVRLYANPSSGEPTVTFSDAAFNAVNALRVLGRWMRMVTIPNQSSVPKAYQEFDADGRMAPSAFYDRVVDVMEELVKFTLLVRDRSAYLTDRYSERKESAPPVAAALAQAAMDHERAAQALGGNDSNDGDDSEIE